MNGAAFGILARMSILIHRRTYDCEAFDEGDGKLRVRGHLNDTKPNGLALMDGEPLTIHDMSVDLVVQTPSFEIIAVEVEMHEHPYQLCRNILDHYQQLVGLTITRGYTHKVRELFGGPSGCSHVGALLQAMGPVAVQATWSMVNLHENPVESLRNELSQEEKTRRFKLNNNTCHVWAEDGEQMGLVEAGKTPQRPGWEIERLVKLGAKPEDIS